MSECNDVTTLTDNLEQYIVEVQHEGKMDEALFLKMKSVDILLGHYGAESLEYQSGKLSAAVLLLDAADILHENRPDDAMTLMVKVDRLTLRSVGELHAALEHHRLRIRLRMIQSVTINRFRQKKFRSALTSGQQALQSAKDLMLVHEIPGLLLNLCSIYSANKSHSNALGHAYFALQKISSILQTVRHPNTNPFLHHALQMETEKEQGRCHSIFLGCRTMDPGSFLRTEVDTTVEVPDFSIEIKPEDECTIVGLRYLLWAASDRATRKVRFPCVELLVDVEEKVRAVRVEDGSRRWGGMLSLAYRAIAVEQEHLGHFQAALLSYNVAEISATQSLGRQHSVTQQCVHAYRSAQKNNEQRTREKKFVVPGKEKLERSTTPNPVSRPRELPRDRRYSTQGTSAAPKSRRVERPQWNEWINSKFLNSSATYLSSSLEQRDSFTSAVEQTDEEPVEASTPSNEESLPTSLQRNVHTAAKTLHRSNNNNSSLDAVPLKAKRRATISPTDAPLTFSDCAFLQQTYKLSYDTRMRPPQPVRTPLARSRSQAVDSSFRSGRNHEVLMAQHLSQIKEEEL